MDGTEREREGENSGCAISHLQKPGWQPVPRAPIAHLLERLTRLLWWDSIIHAPVGIANRGKRKFLFLVLINLGPILSLSYLLAESWNDVQVSLYSIFVRLFIFNEIITERFAFISHCTVSNRLQSILDLILSSYDKLKYRWIFLYLLQWWKKGKYLIVILENRVSDKITVEIRRHLSEESSKI